MHKINTYLDSQNTKDDEECAADEDDVADGLQRGEESLDHQLEAGRPVDHPQRLEGAHQPEHAQHPEDLALLAHDGGDGGVHQRDDHQRPVHPVPVVGEVTVRPVHKPGHFAGDF